MSLISAQIQPTNKSIKSSSVIRNPYVYNHLGCGYNIYNIQGYQSIVLTNNENMDNLARFLNDSTLFDSLKLIFNKPSDCLLSVMYYPFPIVGWQEIKPDYQKNFYLKINGIFSGDLSSDKRVRVYTELPTRPAMIVNEYIPRKFNSFLDYSPYTKLSVQLPFYGEVELNINDFLERFLVVLLNVDLKSGMGKYIILSCKDDFNNYSEENQIDQIIITQLDCKIGIEIPLTTTNYSETIRNMWLGIGQTASIVATAGLASPAIATTASPSRQVSYKNLSSSTLPVSRGAPTGFNIKENAYKSIRTYKPSNQHLGTLASYASFNALQNMYTRTQSEKNIGNYSNGIDNIAYSRIIIRYPRIVDTNYAKYIGRPYGKVINISEISNGSFFKCTSIHINGTTATNEEISEIEDLLSNGVIK